jgi:DNA-binding response OmpR family regulator
MPAKQVVLIVDDEHTIADTLSMILNTHGFESKALYSGEAALAESTCPDIVVADVIMPGISGVDLAVRLREMWPDCRILLMSGAPETATLLDKACSDGHRFEVFGKPFHPSSLIDWILSNSGDAELGKAEAA